MSHCLACQRRTGSAFGIQACFPSNRVNVAGRFGDYVRLGRRRGENLSLLPMTISVWESRRHPWATMPAALEHDG